MKYHLREIFEVLISIFIIFAIFFAIIYALGFFHEVKFSGIDIGENFFGNRDGYFKKLPKNYCLEVSLRENTSLFKVNDTDIDIPFAGDLSHSPVYNTDRIVSDYYIKGFFNDDFLVLCKEVQIKKYVYMSFNFNDGTITYFENEDELYNKYDFTSEQWFNLCNTIEELYN